MASQELYTNVTDQIEQAKARLDDAMGNLDWQTAAREAAVISELALVLDAILAEIEEPEA